MKILLVHGIGHSDADPNYYQPWTDAITAGLQRGGLATEPEYIGFHYDDLFEEYYHGPGTYAAALAEFLATATWHWITDPITNLFRPSRAFPNPYGDTDFRWKTGMVAQLAVEDALRRALRDRLRRALQPAHGQARFDMVAAHSLGTLVSYDFFLHDPQGADLLGGGIYLTFGSQINNDFARNRLFPGPLRVPNVRAWYHLFNDRDPVLTAPIRLSDSRFRQINTHSEAGHSPVSLPNTGPGYLDHVNTQAELWNVLGAQAGARALARPRPREIMRAPESVREKPERRAVIIGINDYPEPANRLDGCVNDAFRMSEVLQERGFKSKNIRVVLNERATADAIRERLAWLLYRAEDGMERVLFYSGHGAQIPGRNGFEEVDHVDECLVPYDFAWTDQTAITDKDFYRLYSDLSYGTRFFAIFDCCHSGGLTRAGSHKVRAIDPPDDIRHRMIRWDPAHKMWLERKLPPINDDFGGTRAEKRAYMGKNLATYKIGRAMRLRRLSARHYRQLDETARAPYLPVLLEACAEDQLAYEYRHGVTSYGAFTYSLTATLRDNPDSTFRDLVATANETLKWLGYDQAAQLIGPRVVLRARVPGAAEARPTGKKKTRK
jgi:hypothetical protein